MTDSLYLLVAKIDGRRVCEYYAQADAIIERKKRLEKDIEADS